MKGNLLITGANGFMGAACCEHFRKQYNVIGLVKDINFKSRLDIQSKISIVQGDILDKELIQNTLSKYEVTHVLHLAAQPIVRICDNDPYSAYMTNVVGTLNILEGMRSLKRPIQKFVGISSDKAYGPHAKLPYTEDSELTVADTYCTSKACEDMIIRSYAKTYNLPACVVRAGNIYGPGDLNLSRLIPNAILKLLQGEKPQIYSGVAAYIREFIYIQNIVDAFDTLLDKGMPGEAYNVGGTPPRQVMEVISLIRNKINSSIPIEVTQKDFYEIPAQYLDATKLQDLGWKAKVDIDEGLDKTISWYKSYIENSNVRI